MISRIPSDNPSDNKERMFVKMIYRKKVTHTAEVTVAIEANSADEADILLAKWLADEDHRIDLEDTLWDNKKEKSEFFSRVYENMDDYNRGCCCDDYFIADPNKLEPLYDLYISYKDDDCCFRERDAYLEMRMDMVLDKLRQLNNTYFLRTAIPAFCVIEQAKKHGCETALYYIAERRQH